MRMVRTIAFFLTGVSLFAQPNIDPRGLGLCGANTVASRGIACVGYNPANLAFTEDVKFSVNLVSMDIKAYNNLLSLALFNQYFRGDASGNPINLEARRPGTDESHKDYLMGLIANDGLSFGLSANVPLPLLNASFGNYAVNSAVSIYTQQSLPKGLFELGFEGNPAGSSYDLSYDQDILIMTNLGFSFAIPFETFNIGGTFNYLMGLGFAGVDSAGGAFVTHPEGLTMDGFYRLTRAIGGNGLAVDIGFTTLRKNNWQFGLAVNNAIGFVNWGADENFINKNISIFEALIPVRSYLQIDDSGDEFSARTLYTYTIDSTNVTSFLGAGFEDLMQDSSMEVPMTDSIRMNYPAVVRLGASYQFEQDITVYVDLSTGLDDYYYAARNWRLALATEWTRFKRFPVRSGMAWGGYHGVEASIGTGFRALMLDVSLGLRFLGGMSFAKAEGIEFALGVTFLR